MNKRAIIIIAAIGIAIGGFIFLTRPKANTGSNAQPSSHFRGPESAKVTLVEYGDFECPGCGNYYPVLRQLESELGDSLRIQFRNFPLPNHQNAFAAHRAAESAHNQGKFFEMHDKLFENRNEWIAESGTSIESAKKIFERYAQEIGLDMGRYKADFPSTAVNDVINADMKEGRRVGAKSTPSFFLNGQKYELANSYEEFKKGITDEIKKLGGTVPPPAPAPSAAPGASGGTGNPGQVPAGALPAGTTPENTPAPAPAPTPAPGQ